MAFGMARRLRWMLADGQRKTRNRRPEEIEAKAEDQAVKIKKLAGG